MEKLHQLMVCRQPIRNGRFLIVDIEEFNNIAEVEKYIREEYPLRRIRAYRAHEICNDGKRFVLHSLLIY